MMTQITQDPLWIRGLLGLHIAAGATAFIFAPLALATRKGGPAHRRWGKIYFWAMAVVAASAIILSAYRPILFLALVAVFSFYAAFYAYRVLGMKKLGRIGTGGQVSQVNQVNHVNQVKWIDWIAASLTFSSSLMLALCGLLRPSLMNGLGVVSIVFGCLGMSLGGRRIYLFLNPPKDKMFWWYDHLQGMIGSYIAAWTAFSVVTIGRFVGSTWYVWLWPTMVGVPAIFLTSRYYRNKFGRRNAPVTVA